MGKFEKHRKLIACDFDGVLHLYVSRWSGAGMIADGPTPGAMRFILAVIDDGRFDLCVVSSRLSDEAGDPAMRMWLLEHLAAEFGAEEAENLLGQLTFSAKRPPAFLTIDDRGWRFEGKWPTMDELAAFVPWNKRPAAGAAVDTGRAEVDALMEATSRAQELKAAARSAVDRVLGARGFGSEPAGRQTIVTDPRGSGIFAFPNDILPTDDPALANRIVSAIFHAWSGGLRPYEWRHVVNRD